MTPLATHLGAFLHEYLPRDRRAYALPAARAARHRQGLVHGASDRLLAVLADAGST